MYKNSHFLKLRSYFNLLSIHPSVYQSIATSLTCPPTHFPLTSSFLISSSSFLPSANPSHSSSSPQTIHHLTPRLSPSTLDPLVFSFNHNSFSPPARGPPRASSRSIYPPVILRSFQSIPLPLSSRFPVCSLAKPSTELLCASS